MGVRREEKEGIDMPHIPVPFRKVCLLWSSMHTVDTHTLTLTPSLLGTSQRQKGQRGWGSKAQGQVML